MSVVEFEIAPAFDHLRMVRSVLTEAIKAEAALSTERLQDLRLAVSEATTNAIEAHSRSEIDTPVAIRVSVTAKTVVVEITDFGGGFEPDKLKAHPPVTDPERLKYERGLGVTLMKRLTDECDIKSGSNGTKVRLLMNR